MCAIVRACHHHNKLAKTASCFGPFRVGENFELNQINSSKYIAFGCVDEDFPAHRFKSLPVKSLSGGSSCRIGQAELLNPALRVRTHSG